MKRNAILLGLLLILAGYAFWCRWESHSKNKKLTPNTSEPGARRPPQRMTERIERAKTDPHLGPVFADPEGAAPLTVLKSLRATDEPVLLEAYQRTTNLLERYSLTMALAFAGGDATVAAFKHTLTDEFKGRHITTRHYSETTDEMRIMLTTVDALGLMASRNDAAFALLKDGTDPWFWQRSVGWKSSLGPDGYGILTSRSIKAIGMTGRKEMPEILEAFSKQPLENSPDPRNWKRTFNSEVVVAAFHYAFVHDRGREAFWEWYYCAPQEDTFPNNGKYSKWKATPEGKK